MSFSSSENLNRIVIEDIYPQLNGGRFAVKRLIGEMLDVWSDIFMDGHDELKAMLCYAPLLQDVWHEVPMVHMGNDRWTASFRLEQAGLYRFMIKAWPDPFATWWRDTRKKRDAGQDIGLEITEGKLLLSNALEKLKGSEPGELNSLSAMLANYKDKELTEALLNEQTLTLWGEHGLREDVVTHAPLKVSVHRLRAEFSTWYEMFPRSQSEIPGESGTFTDCERRLHEIKQMGFDVVYLPPIHPIGTLHRKGKNNALVAGPADPGSPYAIGSEAGGHKAVHPELGTLSDFRRFVKKANALGMEVALDFAVQVSRDHPYLKDHPEWFSFRPDGSLRYAENPPKKYQDIANVDFTSGLALWNELRSVVEFWIEQGVTIFRVDNPHTKPFSFWEWLIESVHSKWPDIIFLSEAFTRPKIMYYLAKIGFVQSYSYFTWRNSKQELTAYLTELTRDWSKEFFRPNFFPTTPDILPYYLQESGRPGFIIRLALAATLSGSYGIVNGYELCENKALPGKEEYADSEKYELKIRDWNASGNIKEFITKLNRIRNENPALQQFIHLNFHTAYNDNILFYSKAVAGNTVFVAINLDYARPQEAFIDMPLELTGTAEYQPYVLDDLLLGHSWQWQGSRQHLRLDPLVNPVVIFRIHQS